MLILGPLGFAAPWVLGALVALPVLWLILRAMPPAPRLVAFPGVALLRGAKPLRAARRMLGNTLLFEQTCQRTM